MAAQTLPALVEMLVATKVQLRCSLVLSHLVCGQDATEGILALVPRACPCLFTASMSSCPGLQASVGVHVPSSGLQAPPLDGAQ